MFNQRPLLWLCAMCTAIGQPAHQWRSPMTHPPRCPLWLSLSPRVPAHAHPVLFINPTPPSPAACIAALSRGAHVESAHSVSTGSMHANLCKFSSRAHCIHTSFPHFQVRACLPWRVHVVPERETSGMLMRSGANVFRRGITPHISCLEQQTRGKRLSSAFRESRQGVSFCAPGQR